MKIDRQMPSLRFMPWAQLFREQKIILEHKSSGHKLWTDEIEPSFAVSSQVSDVSPHGWNSAGMYPYFLLVFSFFLSFCFPFGNHWGDWFLQEGGIGTNLVSNGRVDIRGRMGDKQRTGGWKAAPFIIGLPTLLRRGRSRRFFSYFL